VGSVERQDRLDVVRRPVQRLRRVRERDAPRDEPLQPAGEQLLDGLQVPASHLEVEAAGVDRPEDEAVAEDHLPVPRGQVDLDLLLSAGDAGEDADAVRSQDLHGGSDHGAGPGGLEDDVDRAQLAGQRGDGRGGRNLETVLRCATKLDSNRPHTVILSAGTDGVDGNSPCAGAIADETTIARARRYGLDPEDFLARSDSYGFFDQLDALILTGPTGTNVRDLRIVLKSVRRVRIIRGLRLDSQLPERYKSSPEPDSCRHC